MYYGGWTQRKRFNQRVDHNSSICALRHESSTKMGVINRVHGCGSLYFVPFFSASFQGCGYVMVHAKMFPFLNVYCIPCRENDSCARSTYLHTRPHTKRILDDMGAIGVYSFYSDLVVYTHWHFSRYATRHYSFRWPCENLWLGKELWIQVLGRSC